MVNDLSHEFSIRVCHSSHYERAAAESGSFFFAFRPDISEVTLGCCGQYEPRYDRSTREPVRLKPYMARHGGANRKCILAGLIRSRPPLDNSE